MADTAYRYHAARDFAKGAQGSRGAHAGPRAAVVIAVTPSYMDAVGFASTGVKAWEVTLGLFWSPVVSAGDRFTSIGSHIEQ